MIPKYVFIWMTTLHRSTVSLYQRHTVSIGVRKNGILNLQYKNRQPNYTQSMINLSSSADLPSPRPSILESEIQLTSPKSATVKFFQSLAKKSSFRAENQMTIVEGHRIMIDILSNPKSRSLIDRILVCREALIQHELGKQLLILFDEIQNHSASSLDTQSCDIILTTPEVVEAACDTVTPQGIVAAIHLPPSYTPKTNLTTHLTSTHDNVEVATTATKLTTSSLKQRNRLFLILDGISDPGNLGTLLRSSLAVHIEAVFFLSHCCDYSSPKAVRSAMGATFFVPTCTVQSWEECLVLLHDCGVSNMNMYAATMETSFSLSSQSYYDIDWTGGGSEAITCEPMALIIGKEGQGLSRDVRHAVTCGNIRSVHVPMEDGIESLNAAVCGSIIMFEYHRQQLAKQKMLNTGNDP